MNAEVTYPHIIKENGASAHLERLPRIRVSQIVGSYLVHGWSVDEICRQFPHLHPGEAHAAMAYYFDHKEEIESELESELKEFEQARRDSTPSPFRVRMKRSGLL